ncbi:MAG: acyl-CoA dehydrogenase family protein [Paracoccus sp. (in: a-proteobacteria)]|uniref:acyl-CoA dehydrogenase family protein n=1 Tax=Paracoccus sp. TaxID=267 RepID=UPI00391D0B66
MIPFAAPVEDILASLEMFAGDVPGFDPGLTREVVQHFAGFAAGVLAPLTGPGDRQGCRLDHGRVRMPDGYAEAYRQLAAGGWQGLTAPEAQGGQGMDHLTAAAVTEVFAGANHALQMLAGLVPGAIQTLLAHGSADQQARFIPPLISGQALSTMCLTEAGAGSDLSRIRCAARHDGAGWRITGQKIFISGGDQDMSQAILHLVLARTGTPEDGVHGLSLFLCPSDRDGARNAITVTRIEEKLGLHASPTCQMEFDGAHAEVIGAEGQGLRAMFTMMNHARLDVALQGVGHAARAHAIARAYAADRQQGRRPDGTPAVLADHPDVQRMLTAQHHDARIARAMCHIALAEMARGDRPALVGLLTPLCKITGTEAGIRGADLGIQILGGYGYLEEYGMARVWRDARITSIYEGANGIHALTLTTRGLRHQDGAAIGQMVALTAQLAPGDAAVAAQAEAWQARARDLAAMADVRAEAHEFAAQTGDLLAQAIGVRLRGRTP